MIEKSYAGMDHFIWWMGVVENRQDPLFLGRCQVRIYGIHTDSLVDLPSASLPWAIPVQALNNHTFTTPKETDVVFGFFADGRASQMPIMMGIVPGIETNAQNTGLGYHDLRDDATIQAAPQVVTDREYKTDGTGSTIKQEPVGRYPTANAMNVPTITGLSRFDLNPSDVMQSRISKPYPTFNSAAGKNWQEPKPVFNPVYPYNQAFTSESGHTLEFDDSKGAERVNLSHRSGSFIEFFPDGSKVEEVVKDNYRIMYSNDHIVIMGQAMVTFGSDVYIKAAGNIYLEGGNNMNVSVSGTMNLSVGEALNIKAQSVSMDIQKDLNVTAAGNQFLTAGGDMNIFGQGSVYASAGTDFDVLAGTNANIQASSGVNLVGGTVNMNSGGGSTPATAAKPSGIDSPAQRSTYNKF
jgi:hypothetical protein